MAEQNILTAHPVLPGAVAGSDAFQETPGCEIIDSGFETLDVALCVLIWNAVAQAYPSRSCPTQGFRLTLPFRTRMT
jgi:hypothetical protein